MSRRGMTLIELLVVAVIMSVLAALAMPLLMSSDEERLLGAARLLEQDAAWTRSATLTDPADPAMIRLLPAGTGWEVVRMSDPTMAIQAADGTRMRRVLGTEVAAFAEGVRLDLGPGVTDPIRFEAFGGLATGPSELRLVLQDFRSQCLITIDELTGEMSVSWPEAALGNP
jgi:prepilin-type N-terminal cleavage/methylation domain-containing protein